MHYSLSYIQQHKNPKVADLLVNGEWEIPVDMLNYSIIHEIPVVNGGEDKMIWSGSIAGKIFSIFCSSFHQGEASSFELG